MVYQYANAITNFVAKLTKVKVGPIKKKDGFIKAFLNHKIPLLTTLTTHTPTLLRLEGANGLWKSYFDLRSGVIIEMINSSVVSDHPSFDNYGMELPPLRWKYGFPYFTSVVLTGMDAAMKNNVDIMSHSPRCSSHNYRGNVIDIGAFSAMEKGIFVISAARNEDPKKMEH